ncbi:GGDEF domain-containing protein [Pseudolabrys taiwanensis]|uniref:GGDEF domain-containing protein n=1 Tax=Pseudolabrys taiwanensis TaxID=331696 RepID=A0A346A1X2_9HYPH|nr:GGDEF domain-containing protein [Pseudolabrys taiwanensis]AXK83169.1 GGDEF domain-containing protein [Pseudolabrys taiwanensis]
MQSDSRVYSLPRWRMTRWLVDAGPGVPDDIRHALVGQLYGTLPIFAGGVANTIVVSVAIAARLGSWPFVAWVVVEVAVCLARLIVLMIARRNALTGRKTPTDIYILLGIAWAATVGYGVIVSLVSGDWVASALACLSAAAMVGGICFRNFSAPRLAGTMTVFSLGPCLPGAMIAGEPLMYIVFAQIPMYVFAMTVAAFRLNKMLIATMRAERENDHRARHDALTGLSNRTGLIAAVDARLATAPREGEMLALLFLDLDGFKSVNDTYGHAAGDRLLAMVADRLRRVLLAADIAARIGGDEFVVLADGLTPDRAITLGEHLIAAIATSYDLGDNIAISIGVSVGIAMAPEHGAKFADLLAVADAALYEAKLSGKSRCCMASAETNLAALQRLRGNTGKPGAVGAAA